MRWAPYGSETSTGVAPEPLSAIRDLSPREKIPTWSSKLASSASSCFFAFRGFPRVGFRMPRRFGCLLFRSRKPKSHYKRSFWEHIWPGRPQLRLLLGRFVVVISLLAISCRRFHKTKLRELGFREAFSFGVCSGRLFLEVLAFHSQRAYLFRFLFFVSTFKSVARLWSAVSRGLVFSFLKGISFSFSISSRALSRVLPD